MLFLFVGVFCLFCGVLCLFCWFFGGVFLVFFNVDLKQPGNYLSGSGSFAGLLFFCCNFLEFKTLHNYLMKVFDFILLL